MSEPNPFRNHDRRPSPPDSLFRVSSNWSRLVVLANRAPLSHQHDASGRLQVTRSASGLVTALEPMVRACSGTWVAHGGGSGDRLLGGRPGGMAVRVGADRYRLRYVCLPSEVLRGYYDGFANAGLWPLCHATAVPPSFEAADFQSYRAANVQFASAVVDEADGARALVLVHDYHFALVPQMLRQQLPSATLLAFWHVPWPSPIVFAGCPWARELLLGLLGSHIIGFQTTEDCVNFLGSVEMLLDARVNLRQGTVDQQGRSTSVRTYPVGVESPSELERLTPAHAECRMGICQALGLPVDVRLGVGIDRLDYTKGIDEKFLAIEKLLDARPDLRGRLVFVQVAEPSRERLAPYRDVRARIVATASRVNQRFGNGSYRPIHLLERHYEPAEVLRLYRAADFCYIASLHDGMNLVSKEFVSARDDGGGVLILSRFAGAAHQLREAVLVNPSEIDASARAIAGALAMSPEECSTRMRALRETVARFDASWWADRLLTDASLVATSLTPSDRVAAVTKRCRDSSTDAWASPG